MAGRKPFLFDPNRERIIIRDPVHFYPFIKWTHLIRECGMKGKHLSKEHREMIYSYCINGKSARECHDALFLGSDQICKLKNCAHTIGRRRYKRKEE